MGLDLFISFDHQTLAMQSQDMTTFQTPLGLLHLTTLPMGATNSVQILQGDISFIIQDEMPNIAAAFMDNINVRGPPTCYETNSSGWYIPTEFTDPPPQLSPAPHTTISSDGLHFEVIPENVGICQFVWEHCNDVNQVLQHIKKASGTFSVGKWISVSWKLSLLIISIPMRDITLRRARFKRFWTCQTAILSPGSKDSWVYVVSSRSGLWISLSGQSPLLF